MPFIQGRPPGLPQVKDVAVVSQMVATQVSRPFTPGPHGQILTDLPQPGPGQTPESVNAVFAVITSGRAQPDDFARYVDLWDKLQAAQWHRCPKQP